MKIFSYLGDPGSRKILQIVGDFIIIISSVFQFKMVSQVHTITNNTLVTIGPVKGFPGYNPLLTVMHNLLLTVMIVQ